MLFLMLAYYQRFSLLSIPWESFGTLLCCRNFSQKLTLFPNLLPYGFQGINPYNMYIFRHVAEKSFCFFTTCQNKKLRISIRFDTYSQLQISSFLLLCTHNLRVFSMILFFPVFLIYNILYKQYFVRIRYKTEVS